MTISFIIFIISLIAIVLLFIVKHMEILKGPIEALEKCRQACDPRIVGIEKHCTSKCTVEYTKSVFSQVYNTLTHEFARFTANIAKKIEWRARHVAHRSAKAKQEGGEQTRENGYLKDVQSHKDSLDTAKVAQDAKL